MQLSEKRWREIDAKLPPAAEIQGRLLLNVDLITLKTGPEKKLDVASVCLRDASDAFFEVVYALRQAYASLAWYREEDPDGPFEKEACFLGKFYTDDAALRLYSTGEHIANFILNILDINKSDLKRFKRKNISQAHAVGKYLIAREPTHGITLAIKSLLEEDSWDRVIKYRNTWVHEQPPIIEGSGIVYERKERWIKTQYGYSGIGIGNGDKPLYTVDCLLEMVVSASHALNTVLVTLTNILFDLLRTMGVEIDGSSQIIIKY